MMNMSMKPNTTWKAGMAFTNRFSWTRNRSSRRSLKRKRSSNRLSAKAHLTTRNRWWCQFWGKTENYFRLLVAVERGTRYAACGTRRITDYRLPITDYW